jgi:hypothetical protein
MALFAPNGLLVTRILLLPETMKMWDRRLWQWTPQISLVLSHAIGLPSTEISILLYAVRSLSTNRDSNNLRLTAPLQCLLTYLPTPCSTVLLEKLTGLQLVKKCPAFYGTRRFIAAFTSARQLSLSWASSIQSVPPHPTSWRSMSILSSHLHLVLPSGSFPSGSVHVRGFVCKCFVIKVHFHGEELTPRSTPKLEDHPCRLSATAYSIYSQLPSILEAVPPSATWGRAMP